MNILKGQTYTSRYKKLFSLKRRNLRSNNEKLKDNIITQLYNLSYIDMAYNFI